ncbi:hypothetical protein [Comamonas sp.]
MKKANYDPAQVKDLILQMMETELGGQQVYEMAISCALNEDLKSEWEEYLQETMTHQNVVQHLCDELGIDAKEETPSRAVVRHIGESLVAAMVLAKETGTPQAAELVACECVVHAETKDHSNWELLGMIAKAATGTKEGQVMQAAYETVEEDEDHHLFHTKGWCRELAIQSLGMPAVLPPPEEVKDVETAIGASRAQQQRDAMLGD